jgi:hypothetical protein
MSHIPVPIGAKAISLSVPNPNYKPGVSKNISCNKNLFTIYYLLDILNKFATDAHLIFY